MAVDVDAQKRSLRRLVRASRRSRSAEERARLAADLTRQLVAVVEAAGVTRFAAYLSSPEEPDTRGLLQWARDRGIEAWLPAVRGTDLWWGVDDGSEVPGALGTTEPAHPTLSPDRIAEVPLLLIPAAAVDRHGMRLGWGAGFLDRTLTRVSPSAVVYGVVFAPDVVDAVPSAAHDRPVHGVITPSGLQTTIH